MCSSHLFSFLLSSISIFFRAVLHPHLDMSCPVLSGVFSGEDSPRLAEFLRASSLLREQFRFAHTTDLKLGEKYGVHSE